MSIWDFLRFVLIKWIAFKEIYRPYFKEDKLLDNYLALRELTLFAFVKSNVEKFHFSLIIIFPTATYWLWKLRKQIKFSREDSLRLKLWCLRKNRSSFPGIRFLKLSNNRSNFPGRLCLGNRCLKKGPRWILSLHFLE